MSAQVALGSKLPGEPDINGLDALHDELVENPDVIRVAVIWFDVPKGSVDYEKGTTRPSVRVRRIEPIGTVDDIDAAVVKVVRKAHETRIGSAPLPFDEVVARKSDASIVEE